MSIEISRTGKNGSYLGRQSVRLLNGQSVNAAIRLSPYSTNFGRTIFQKGGNVEVKYDNGSWFQVPANGP